MHEGRDQIVRRFRGEVFSEPVDGESLTEAACRGLLFQAEEPFGVDGSDGAGKSWGHAEIMAGSPPQGRAITGSGCDLDPAPRSLRPDNHSLRPGPRRQHG